MDTLLLFWLFIIGIIVTAILIFIVIIKIAKTNTDKSKQKQLSPNTEALIDSLKDELSRIRSSYATAQSELQDLKNKNPDTELDQLRKESSVLKNELVNRERDKENLLSQNLIGEDEFKKKNERLQILEKENEIMAAKLKDLEAHIAKLENEMDSQNTIVTAYKKKKNEESKRVLKEEATEMHNLLGTKLWVGQKKKKIGEILLEYNFITKDILDKALEYQKQFGGNITQYLLAHGYIEERQLAQCLSAQFGVPYLPLASYSISEDIIKLVPLDFAKKYLLVPVDKQGGSLMVVMADPLDTKALKEVEEITGYKTKPFVGIISEIIAALEFYYKVTIK